TGRARPRRKRSACRTHRRIDVSLIAVGNFGDRFARCGTDVIEVGTADRRTKVAADEISEPQGSPPDRTPIDRRPDPTNPTARSPTSDRADATESPPER